MTFEEIRKNFVAAAKKMLDQFSASSLPRFTVKFHWNNMRYKAEFRHYKSSNSDYFSDTVEVFSAEDGQIIGCTKEWELNNTSGKYVWSRGFDKKYDYSEEGVNFRVDDDAIMALLVNWNNIKEKLSDIVTVRDEALAKFEL